MPSHNLCPVQQPLFICIHKYKNVNIDNQSYPPPQDIYTPPSCSMQTILITDRRTETIYYICLMSQLILVKSVGFAYQNILKPLYFLQDPEKVHHSITTLGEKMGEIPFVRNISSWTFAGSHPSIEQTTDGMYFRSPLGLAAGFDYEARLTQILPSLGFGFHTIGTITNMPYDGNPTPRLGRLPKSKSLMVNKGFKNDGAEATIDKLEKKQFSIPLGVSIGRTNSRKLTTQKESVKDIIHAFTLFEQSPMKHSYYELNISCPNLYGGIGPPGPGIGTPGPIIGIGGGGGGGSPVTISITGVICWYNSSCCWMC